MADVCGAWVLPLLASGVGGLAKFLGNKQAENAQWRSFSAERERQQRFTQEQQALFQDSLTTAGGMADPGAQAAAIERRETPLRLAIAPPSATDYLPGSRTAAPVVRAATDRAQAGQRATSGSLAAAIARLGGFGDQLLDTSIANARNAGRIGQVASFMGGSAAASEAEVRAAANKGSFLRGVGSLAQQIGAAMLGAPGAPAAKVVPLGGSGGIPAPFFPTDALDGRGLSWVFGS